MAAEIVTIRDATTGDSAQILVSQGFNCFDWRATGAAGETIPLLWTVEQFAEGDKRPSSSGIPLLFPFPGRIDSARLTWQGQSYELTPGDAHGNALHGFVHTRPWRVIAQSEHAVTGEFHAAMDDPQLLDHWPSDFRIRATYTIHGRELLGEYELSNPSNNRLPCGFGTHPYFQIPLSNSGDASHCHLQLPIRKRWRLEKMLATGEVEVFEHADAWQQGQPIAQAQFDDVFTDLVANQGVVTGRVIDNVARRAIRIDFPQAIFPHCVVYTPPHRHAVCIEPYSCAPDAFRLARQGIDAGLRILAPGEQITTSMRLVLELL